ncbi:MAG: YbaK/EbsC family protein [Oligoflexia bacterium]|nr:YbaK/EbsC family protein [Oligoflexia bacterium]
MTSSVQKVDAALKAAGITASIRELPVSTRTALDAASALDCHVSQIAKSIIFEGCHSGRPILVIAGGQRRIDEAKVATYIGEPIKKASADFVRTKTGFVIGGVAPVGSAPPIVTIFDRELLKLEYVWIAAGTPNSVCKLSPEEVCKASGAIPADL